VANKKSAEKANRQSVARAQRNRSVKSAVKTRITRFRNTAAGDATELDQLAGRAVSALDRAASKGILHKNNAARRKSRVAKRLNAMSSGEVQPAEAPKPAARGRRGRTS
jgi:small subunit ribosomal protein S20